MNIIPKFKGTVQNGRFFPYEGDMYEIYLQSLEGKECALVINEWKEKHSDNQRRYYFGVVVKLISEECGWSKDYTHSFLATMFLKEYAQLKGKDYVVVLSFTSLKTDTCSHYIEECKQWASIELGLFIPDAEKLNY